MLKRWSEISLITLCVALSLLLGKVTATEGPTFIQQIKETMANVRSGKTVDTRRKSAEHLFDLTCKINLKNVDDKTLSDLVSLLDVSDEGIRYWVVSAIGNLGPRAKVAVPKLLKMLPAADDLPGVITSAEAIRYALKRMGVKPPPYPKKSNRIAG